MSVTPQREPLLPRLQIDSLRKAIKRGERLDGRGPLDYRPISVVLNPLDKADGSALIRLGETQVMAGIKLELGEPFEDRPNEGVLQVHAEFVPLASPSFEPGPPDENAIEVARVVDRTLREPRVIKLEELAIEPGRLVWVVYDDIYLLDHFGNIMDASMLASMLALSVAGVPNISRDEAGVYKIDRQNKARQLPINLLATSITLGVVDDVVIVDPSLDEEAVVETFITIGVDEKERIVGMQKRGGDIPLSLLDSVVDIAVKKGAEIIGYMKKILNSPQEYMKPLDFE